VVIAVLNPSKENCLKLLTTMTIEKRSIIITLYFARKQESTAFDRTKVVPQELTIGELTKKNKNTKTAKTRAEKNVPARGFITRTLKLAK
jgi:hypothetical protein